MKALSQLLDRARVGPRHGVPSMPPLHADDELRFILSRPWAWLDLLNLYGIAQHLVQDALQSMLVFAMTIRAVHVGTGQRIKQHGWHLTVLEVRRESKQLL